MNVWQYTVLDVNSAGGVEKHITGVSSALEKLGHEVHIGTSAPAFKTKGPVILHTHGDAWPHPRFLATVKLGARPAWIQICHGTSVGRVLACKEYLSLSGWKGSLRDFLLARLAAAAVAVSERAPEEARRYFRLKGPAAVIPNGTNPAVFTPLESLSKAPRLAFLGRTGDRVKNIPRLLEACAGVAREHPDFELWMAPGTGEEITGKPAFVRNLGQLGGTALSGALSQCRALALVSFYEGDPLVLYEAQAMGLPVIASDIPQLHEALRDYGAVTFVDPNDPASIGKAIHERIYGGNSTVPRPRIRSWDDVAGDLVKFYGIVLSERRKATR